MLYYFFTGIQVDASLYSFYRTFIPAFEYLTPLWSKQMPVYTLFTELLSQLSSTWPHCGPQIPVCTLDHPVCHDLSGDMDVIPQEFLADPIKRKAVYVLGIHDACCKWWSEQAVTQQIFWAVCFYDRLVVPAGIDCHVMFLNGFEMSKNLRRCWIMCYLVAKDRDTHGCFALKTTHGKHLV